MAWYYGTFSCGHEGRIDIVGPVKDRQWKADRKFEGLCYECHQKHLQEEKDRVNQEAAEKAKQMELPELQGTEKQIAWANTLRNERINMLQRHIDKSNSDNDKQLLAEIMEWYVKENINASWWIEHRYEDFNIIKLGREYMNSKKTVIHEINKDDIKLESTVNPENKKYDGIVEIERKDDIIKARYEKNDDFIKIVKKLGYKWESVWQRKIDQYSGPIEERMAELGNKLLNAGFAVMIFDSQIREKAINGTYEPECIRWVGLRTKGEYKDWLFINWTEQNDDMYKKARMLPSSKWSTPSVVVKIEYYREIEDFADLHSFKITDAARNAIMERKEIEKNIPIVRVKKAKKLEERNKLKEILDSSKEILEDLKDED